jgi:Dyp-type peroxidase family
MSLKAENGTQATEVGRTIRKMWDRLANLKKGVTADLNVNLKHRKKGNLTVLIAYGPMTFILPGAKKLRPASFNDKWNFNPPHLHGGGEVLEGSQIKYSTKAFQNHLLADHIVFQFIADNEFYTNRAALEVWRELYKMGKKSGRLPLQITGLYTGFQRFDKRNWLGFHDGVSNLKTSERASVIGIDSKYLGLEDKWILNGTYLAFLRIAIDLEKWDDMSVMEQEKLIGRDKLTGCPLIGIDQKGKPIKDPRCPVPGTFEIIDSGNEHFREHPHYGTRIQKEILQYSHIGRSRPNDAVPTSDRKSSRIYRQGFEYLASTTDYPGFIAGLNFISFQNTPERLLRALTYRPTEVKRFSQVAAFPNFDKFFTVISAGIFLAPPLDSEEPFPGAGIFFSESELRRESNLNRMYHASN